MASAYLNARARALIGQILPTETLLRLADLPTVENITRQLESQGYFRYRNGAEEALSPVQRLWLELDQDYRAAITVVSGPGRAVLRAMYGQREIAFIKAMLGCVRRGIPPAARTPYIGGLRLLERAREADFDEAVDLADAVERTPAPYRATLQNALHRVEEQGSLFPMEIGLDLLVLHGMWLAARSLTGDDRMHVGAILGTWYDVFNVTSACRLRVLFGASNDETLGYLIHHGQHLRLSHRRALAGAEGLAQLLAAVRDTPYAPFLVGAKSAGEVERGMMRYFRQCALMQLAGYPFHVGSTVAHLFLKYIEITNLTHVYEAKRRDAKNIRLRELLI